MSKSKDHFLSDRMPSAAPSMSLFKDDGDKGADENATLNAEAAQPQHKQKEGKPHHLGHRERLRQRFLKDLGEAMPDYEIVEMLLALGIPRKDTKPLAKLLLKQFKSFPALLAADYDDLCAVKGMTKNAATGLKLVEVSAKRMMQQSLIGKPILNSWSRLTDYLYATMAQEKKEHFRVLFLDRKNNLIADEIQQSGTVDQTPIYPREVLKRALELSATALILVHNHPSGDPSPSAQDIQMTNAVIDAAKALDMVVHDHIIISQKGYTSMRNEGFLDN